jgi:hypothetical protein
MNMTGTCATTVRVPIQDILNATPEHKLAMFEVTSIPVGVDDSVLGERVYVHKGNVYDFIMDEKVIGLEASDLRFLRYIPA